MRVEGTYGEWYDRVRVDGVDLDPAPSQRVWNHSPDGFAWSYAGSGPAQLALALLLKAGVPPGKAVRLHQRFKMQFVAPLPRTDFVVDVDVAAWVAARLAEE